MKVFEIQNSDLSFIEAEQSDEQLHQEISQVCVKKSFCVCVYMYMNSDNPMSLSS